DFDAQYQTSVGRRHKVSVGGEVRSVDATFTGTFAITVTPPQVEAGADSLFVQDIFRLTDRLHLIGGLKVEYDHRIGWNEQPTLRGIWDAGRQHVWAAVSRAVRTPSLLDTGQRLNIAAVPTAGLPLLVAAFGNPDYQPERLLLTEAGYRLEAGSTLVVDATVFHGSYDGLSTNEPLPPTFEATPAPAHILVATELANLLQATTTGVEVAGHWTPHHAWRFDGSYSALRITPHPYAESHDPAAVQFDGNAPAHQWQLHSSTFVAPHVEVNTGLYYTGRLRDLNTDAYLRADARVEWRINKTLSLIGVGQNLLTPLHAEFTDPQSPVLPTLVPRSGRIDLKWAR
ncbi:MAG TPA: TonB-dependent receptor, partial [Vicinamibacterales bacterium]|nr:TonB-dependent receptor [Vicinamibacterales bacterium]